MQFLKWEFAIFPAVCIYENIFPFPFSTAAENWIVSRFGECLGLPQKSVHDNAVGCIVI